MKVELDDLRIGLSAIQEHCMVGILDPKKPGQWRHKKDVHNDFLHAVVTAWSNKKQTLTHSGYRYEISVKKTKIIKAKK